MIYFVRHGQTINNVHNVFYGQDVGPGLDEIGIQQIQALALQLKDVVFDVCYCSPRRRTRQTADIILQYHPNVPIIEDIRLAERNWGQAKGQNAQQYEPNRWHRYRQFDVADVETVDQMQERLLSFYQSLPPDKNILVVSHSGCYRVSAALFNGAPKDHDFGSIKLKNGALAIFKNAPRRF